MKRNDFSEIGFIRKTNGFKGEIILALHDEISEDISQRNFFFLDLNASMVPFFVERFSDVTGNVVIKFEDVNSQTEASALVSKKVFLLFDSLSKKSEKGLIDLQGFFVFDEEIGFLGTVKTMIELAGQLLISFEYKGAEILLPLHDETLSKILKRKRELHVKLPDGLLEVYLSK